MGENRATITPAQFDLSRRLRKYLQVHVASGQKRLPPERVMADTPGVTRNRLRGALRRTATQGEIWAKLTVVLDLMHVSEYLWSASLAFHPEASPQREQW